jgi:hypothetical protein
MWMMFEATTALCSTPRQQRATEPIQFPDHQGVGRAKLVEDLCQLWAFLERAAGADDVLRRVDAVSAAAREIALS